MSKRLLWNSSSCAYFLNSTFNTGIRPLRAGVQGKLLIFTSTKSLPSVTKFFSETNNVVASAPYVSSLTSGVFELLLGTLFTNPVDFTALNATFIANITNPYSVSQTITDQLINNGICHWDREFGLTLDGLPARFTMTTSTTCAPSTVPTTTPTAAPTATTTTGRPTPPSPFDRECSCNASNLWLDIIFLIDCSESMGSQLAQVRVKTADKRIQVQANIATLVLYMNLGNSSQSVRVGLVTYASNATVSHDLNSFANVNSFLTTIYGLKALKDPNVNLEK